MIKNKIDRDFKMIKDITNQSKDSLIKKYKELIKIMIIRLRNTRKTRNESQNRF